MQTKAFIREKNMVFFHLMAEDNVRTLSASAKSAGIGYAHARRLVKVWVADGLLVKVNSLHGVRWMYTPRGLEMRMAVEDMLLSCGVLK